MLNKRIDQLSISLCQYFIESKAVDRRLQINVSNMLALFYETVQCSVAKYGISETKLFEYLAQQNIIPLTMGIDVFESVHFLSAINTAISTYMTHNPIVKNEFREIVFNMTYQTYNNEWSSLLFQPNKELNGYELSELLEQLRLITHTQNEKILQQEFYRNIDVLMGATRLLSAVLIKNSEAWKRLPCEGEMTAELNHYYDVLLPSPIKFRTAFIAMAPFTAFNQMGHIDEANIIDPKVYSPEDILNLSLYSALSSCSISFTLEQACIAGVRKVTSLQPRHYQQFLEGLFIAIEKNKFYMYLSFLNKIGYLSLLFSPSLNESKNSEISWGNIEGKCMVEHFHAFTIDEHTMQVLRALELLFAVSHFKEKVKETTVGQWNRQSITDLILPTISQFEHLNYYRESAEFKLLKTVSYLINANQYLNYILPYIQLVESTTSETWPFFNQQNIMDDDYIYFRNKEVSVVLEIFFKFAPAGIQTDSLYETKKSVILAALLHDIGKASIQKGNHEQVTAENIEPLLKPFALSHDTIHRVTQLTLYHSVINHLPATDDNNPIDELLASLISDFDALTWLTLADRLGCANQIESNITQAVIDSFLSKVKAVHEYQQQDHSIDAFIYGAKTLFRASGTAEVHQEVYAEYLLSCAKQMGPLYQRYRALSLNQLSLDIQNIKKRKINSTLLKDPRAFLFVYQPMPLLEPHDIYQLINPVDAFAVEFVALLRNFGYVDEHDEIIDPVQWGSTQSVDELKLLFQGQYGDNFNQFYDFFRYPVSIIIEKLKSLHLIDMNCRLIKNADACIAYNGEIIAEFLSDTQNKDIVDYFSCKTNRHTQQLYVYGKDYLGLATDLVQFLHYHHVKPHGIQFFTGKKGEVIDIITLPKGNSDAHRYMNIFFKTVMNNQSEAILTHVDIQKNIFSLEEDQSLAHPTNVSFALLQDQYIISISYSDTQDLRLFAKMANFFKENQLNILYASLNVTTIGLLFQFSIAKPFEKTESVMNIRDLVKKIKSV